MKQHFVTFLYPGSFFPEESTVAVESWDPEPWRNWEASRPYRPFAFYFTTRERGDADLDSRQTAKSGRYYLGGETFHVDELPQDESHRILRSNIAQHEGKTAIRCSTGNWQPFLPEDTLFGGTVAAVKS